MLVLSKKKVAQTEVGRYEKDALVLYQGSKEASVIFSNDDSTVTLRFRDGSPTKWKVPLSEVQPRQVSKNSHNKGGWPMPTPIEPLVRGKSREFQR